MNAKHIAKMHNGIDKSLVKTQKFLSNKNNFKYQCSPSPMGWIDVLAVTVRFTSYKMEEYGALKTEIEALKSEVDATCLDKTQI